MNRPNNPVRTDQGVKTGVKAGVRSIAEKRVASTRGGHFYNTKRGAFVTMALCKSALYFSSRIELRTAELNLHRMYFAG
jgi:hypothetical protein